MPPSLRGPDGRLAAPGRLGGGDQREVGYAGHVSSASLAPEIRRRLLRRVRTRRPIRVLGERTHAEEVLRLCRLAQGTVARCLGEPALVKDTRAAHRHGRDAVAILTDVCGEARTRKLARAMSGRHVWGDDVATDFDRLYRAFVRRLP